MAVASSAGLSRKDMYKCRSPSWKDAYRQRCRDKLKSNREKTLSLKRALVITNDQNSNDDQHMDIQEIMATEWNEMKKDWNLDGKHGDDLDQLLYSSQEVESLFDVIQEELRLEEQELLRACERHLQEEEQLCLSLQALTAFQVICPVCQKNALMENKGVIFCKCGVRINTEQDCLRLENVKDNLDAATQQHSQGCQAAPSFHAAQQYGISTLTMSCSECDFLTIVI